MKLESCFVGNLAREFAVSKGGPRGGGSSRGLSERGISEGFSDILIASSGREVGWPGRRLKLGATHLFSRERLNCTASPLASACSGGGARGPREDGGGIMGFRLVPHFGACYRQPGALIGSGVRSRRRQRRSSSPIFVAVSRRRIRGARTIRVRGPRGAGGRGT